MPVTPIIIAVTADQITKEAISDSSTPYINKIGI